MVNKGLKAIAINKRFSSFTKEEQNDMLKNYTVIIRDFKRKPPDEVDDYNEYHKYLKYKKRTDRMMYFHKVPLRLTEKEFFWIRVLLREKGIEESIFNSVIFRLGKCKNPNSKHKDNLKNSVNAFKRSFRKKINKYCENNKCYFNDSKNPEDTFENAFDFLIYYKVDGRGYQLKTEFDKVWAD